MKVELEEIQGLSGCVVKLDTCQVNFRHRDEAHAFVTRLQERLCAPHELPDERQARLGDVAARRYIS
ncbi:MAG TPA: hypothetical protein VER09_02115 [Pseudomonas sp.]|nr:hypothetical protein [Pseudomonas sp.]